jgi:hypothetical protein
MLKFPKRTGIQPSLSLKGKIHPWDMAAERAKAKHLQAPKAYTTTNCKEGPISSLSQIVLIPQDANPFERDLRLIDDPDSPDEGFFPCPFCTCWFTHKKNLEFHVNKWCDR